MVKIIEHFEGDYRFLSNFWPALTVFDGEAYKTVEHAYQAAKTMIPKERYKIHLAATAAEAKKLGQKITLRHDWKDIRVGIMEELLISKFTEPSLKKMLIETGDAELIEGNTWNDTFWGICNGKGENLLGKLLMKIRDMANMDIQKGIEEDPKHCAFYNSGNGKQPISVEEFMKKQFENPEIKAVYDRLSKR